MPVTYSQDPWGSGKKRFHVRRTKKPLTGSRLKSHQAEDMHFAMTDPDEKFRQSPQVKKPKELIEFIRWSGDELTAQDQALYEYMLETARHDAIERDTHRVWMGDILKYLEIDHVDRVEESLKRIARTRVSYELQEDEFHLKRGTFTLADYDLTVDLRSGDAFLEYRIPEAVRRVILKSESYGKIEINAFPKFRCRYTARLYQRLAWRAGRDEPLRKPWLVEPRQLADELGYPYKAWNFAHFERDCLDRVLSDIREFVTRFTVIMTKVPGKGRGRPVAQLMFETSGIRKTLKETRITPLGTVEKGAVEAPDPVHGKEELPSVGAVARAKTMTEKWGSELSDGWRATLDRAKNYQPENGPFTPGFDEYQLLQIARSHGADEAFGQWAQALERNEPIRTARTPVAERRLPPPARNQAFRTPAVTPLPLAEEPEPVADEPDLLDDGFEASTFAGTVVDDPFDWADTQKDSEPAPRPLAPGEHDVLDDLEEDSIPF